MTNMKICFQSKDEEPVDDEVITTHAPEVDDKDIDVVNTD
ncbi:11776_t:CDS:2 [Diversispora eburnea]|uniref:11776_t:CDS:1 n=1 Tax=Diversispora eburnea TaxID=1213867 RepID=A0A9N9ASG5_9GLOM|nr:11776_t:CDS:2 [Diversispora eburnea]